MWENVRYFDEEGRGRGGGERGEGGGGGGREGVMGGW